MSIPTTITTAAYPGWTFTKDAYGDWRGTHEDGRRSALKGKLEGAQNAVANARYVCPDWPWCDHATDLICSAAWARQRAQHRAGRGTADARRPER